ncbi:O-antigen ligase [Nostoc sp. 2RC]|uniref:O-antigen ligase family protein n=1 Tax=Nostoc sp. 2RC TaxID=2485484 RepID=UPI001627D3E9|nr:O-antigen ligase family protein [Nostoc sp. 2RC]MBC1239399.1 O-antigen ligase family protein [Nostoc sp. 2RC]
MVGIAFVSIFWSDVPSFTLEKLKGLLRSTLFGVYLAAYYKPKDLMQLLAWIFGILAVLNLVVTLAMPSYGITMINDEFSWKGLSAHKQYLGRIMLQGAILFLLLANTNKKFRWIMWLGCSLTVVLIVLSKSKTAWVGLAISLLILPTFTIAKLFHKSRAIIYLIVVLSLGSLAILAFDNQQSINSAWETIIVDVLNKSPDLNGRVPVWNLAIESGLKRPWLGYGYQAFWETSEGAAIRNVTWARNTLSGNFHSHNGYIELFLQLGFIGLLLFSINFFTLLVRLMNLIFSTRSITSFWMLEYVILMFLFNYTDLLTFISPHTLWSVYIAINLSTIYWRNMFTENTNISEYKLQGLDNK